MGVEPVWSDAGRVEDVEPIPLEELGRPRIDVTTRVSGLFRDAFPAAAGVVHDAVDAVVDLDEPHEMNYVKKHVEEEPPTLSPTAWTTATPRARRNTVCSRHAPAATAPGRTRPSTRATGTTGGPRRRVRPVGRLRAGVAASDRRSRRLRAPLSAVDATVKIEDTAEQDEFDSSDWYAFHGGFVSAVT